MRESYTNPSETKWIEYFGIFDLTKRICGKQAYKTNPRNESFEHCKDSWIQSLGFVWIWACLNYVYVLRRICQDSLDSCKQANLLKISLRNESTNQIFKDRTCKSGFANLWSRICQPWNETNLFEVWIRDHNTKRIHVFYESLKPGVLNLLVFAYPQINYCPKIVPPSKNKEKKNKLVYVLLLVTTTIHCLFAISEFFFFFGGGRGGGYLTNLSHLR